MNIPADFPVQPLKDGDKAKCAATCGTCGLSWDDGISTSYTPAPSARCPFEAFHEVPVDLKPHWSNPYTSAVPVPIEELAECAYGLGERYRDVDGSSFIMTKEKMLEHWRRAGDKLDAYILPQPSGFHSIGIRYGAEDPQYLSPMGDQDKVAALLKKYR